MCKADIGLIGLAVMGENLVMNMESKGFCVNVFNRSPEKTEAFLKGRAAGKKIMGSMCLEDLVSNLKRPRKIMLMVKAGAPVDSFIQKLLPLLESGDVIIDGGNSNFHDTEQRCAYLNDKNIYFVGMGVSGGEEGALKGPSLMPGCTEKAWEIIKPIFQAIAAKAADNMPCCERIGSDGSGHFVKMVHNGIEYGDMQLICEAYSLLRLLGGIKTDSIADIFEEWNNGPLNSYLIEITASILRYKEKDGSLLLDKILDKAGQKGTGRWTVEAALEEGVPITLISEAVFARSLSAAKGLRIKASSVFPKGTLPYVEDKQRFADDVRDALLASKIISYAQGFMLMHNAASRYQWRLNYAEIASIWRSGCIIRSSFLNCIKGAYTAEPMLENMLFAHYFSQTIKSLLPAWRRTASATLCQGIPAPAITSALAWFDGFVSEKLPANLIQAQRDYFGAHAYERTDMPSGSFFHTDWAVPGESSSSKTYNA